jgi:hypothetical protein
MSPASLIVPFGALAVTGVAGLGLAGLIAPRASRDAQAALAPLITAAVVFVTSPILLVGVPPLALAATTLGLLALITVACRRQSVAIARRSAAPAGLACFAIVLYAGPALEHGTWAAATTGNQDAYVWVSQARSLEHSSSKGPAATTPDRVPHELLTRESWPTGIPGGLAELAATTRVDPVRAYGALSVLIAAMLALSVFFGARGCMRWSALRSAIATVVVSLNGLMLVSSFYGWQAQLLLTTAGTLLVLMLPDCFEKQSGLGASVGPSLFAASAVAIYGWTFAPFAVIAAAVCVVWYRRRSAETMVTRAFVRRVGAIVVLAAVLGAVPIVRALTTFADGAQHISPTVLRFWNQYAWAFPPDALGFVPRTPRDASGVGWEVVAGIVAAALIVRGLRSARSSHNPRETILAAAGVTIIVELAALLVSGSSPYPSLKLMAYSTPLLTLLALNSQPSRSAEADRGPGVRLSAVGTALLNVLAVCLFLATTGLAFSTGFTETRPATNVLPVARAAGALPAGKVVLVSVEDTWNQVWLAYFLRDRPIALRSPSVAFLGYSANDAKHAQRYDAPADFVIRDRSPGPAIWHDRKFGIYAVKNHPGK